MGFSKTENACMRICIDGRLWNESGIGRYIRNLVFELGKIDSENEYLILLLKKDFQIDLPSNFKKVVADFKWYGLSEQVKLLGILNKLNPDLVHFPHFNVPVFYKRKYIVTIHDLIHQHYQTRDATTKNPLTFKIKKIGYKKVFGSAIKNSYKIITPSEFVKNQLIKEWRVDADKITVTLEGVDQSIINLSKLIKNSDFAKVYHKFGLTKPYLFYVGNAQPHKNIEKLINVFDEIKKTSPNYSLVLSGPEHHFWEKIKKQADSEGIFFTGFVSERELVALFKNASLFIMPSKEEGFGIPVLEAMANGTPVVCSKAGSLPEVGGEAVMYFDPEDEKDMLEKITQVLEDKKLQKNLIKKGQQRYREFSWKKLAEQTLKIYRESV